MIVGANVVLVAYTPVHSAQTRSCMLLPKAGTHVIFHLV